MTRFRWTCRAAAWLGAVMLLVPTAFARSAAGASSNALKHCPPTDWCTYHRTYDGQRYSPLAQIDRENVDRLAPVWMFQPGRADFGLESTPLVIDGEVYLAVSPSRVFKLKGSTGQVVWSWTPEIDQAVLNRTLFPHTRGLAVGDGRVYVGTVDGHVAALAADTGEALWKKRLVNSAEKTVGFSGAGTFVEGRFIIGMNGGEYPIEGKIFALDAATGETLWTFHTTGRGNPAALDTWGGASWKIGGGGSWQPGSVDFANHQLVWGVGNPNPDFVGDGGNWETEGPRPGRNLYTSSLVGLNMDTGEVQWHFQEVPHDPFDYDAAAGEVVLIRRHGRQYVVHPGKNGFIHVLEAGTGRPVNVYPNADAINWSDGYDVQAREWKNIRWPEWGKGQLVCPDSNGGHSWNAGSYSHETGLFYRIVNNWCMQLTPRKAEPVLNPPQALFGAEWRTVGPPREDQGLARPHAFIKARDPISGELAWKRRYDIIPNSSLLSTAGGLLFVGGQDGFLQALDAGTGQELWKFNNGSGHNGGIVSYADGGRQYILAATGMGSHVGHVAMRLYAGKLPYKQNSGVLVAYALPFGKP